jgi:hypothetical protein
MAKELRYLLALGIILLAAAPGAASGPKGYLALVGPTPLRFRARPVVVAKVELPPLPQPQSAAAPSDATNQLAVPATPTPTNEAAGYSPEAVLARDNPIAPWSPDGKNPTAVESGPVNPQLVTGYLVPPMNTSEPTNSVGPGATVGRLPLPAFVPPLPPPRSSQAIYESH